MSYTQTIVDPLSIYAYKEVTKRILRGDKCAQIKYLQPFCAFIYLMCGWCGSLTRHVWGERSRQPATIASLAAIAEFIAISLVKSDWWPVCCWTWGAPIGTVVTRLVSALALLLPLLLLLLCYCYYCYCCCCCCYYSCYCCCSCCWCCCC